MHTPVILFSEECEYVKLIMLLDKNVQKSIAEIQSFYFMSRNSFLNSVNLIMIKHNGGNNHEQI